MRCGKCADVEMVSELHDGIEIDRCPSCSGIFLDWGELTNLVNQAGIAEIDNAAPPSEASAAMDAMSANCPRCGDVVMRPVDTRFGLRLDNCGKCGGVFLDQGEFRAMVEALNALAPPAAS